jgi:hypothetical protein
MEKGKPFRFGFAYFDVKENQILGYINIGDLSRVKIFLYRPSRRPYTYTIPLYSSLARHHPLRIFKLNGKNF